MCGIAGIVRLGGDPVSPVDLQRMTDAISHRGPDGEGQWIEGNVGLGHRRLAIVDLSPAGHQPMVSVDQRYVLTYNGELYNFRELRAVLESVGHRFHSTTDSEVVLNSLAEWGIGALERLNGMFAFAFWDRAERRLLIARDRYGIKPLYVSTQGGTFAFGSEQKAITALPHFHRDLDKAGLVEYLTFQNFFSNRTLTAGIQTLPAGHFANLEIGKGERELRLTQYWDYDFAETPQPASDEAYREELDRLFTQAVNRQLIADVEIGSYLSGGMDSGSITSVAARSFPSLKTFTLGFDLTSASGLELAYDERQVAEAMSYAFQTEHYEMVLKAGDMERCLPRLVRHLEEPRVGQSYPNFYAAQLASKFVKVVLSGVGGDEMFGGYPWRYFRGADEGGTDDFAGDYFAYWQRLLPLDQLEELLRPIHPDVADADTEGIFRGVLHGANGGLGSLDARINASLRFEAKTFLTGLLTVEDKLSMAHGLETRVPFLDNDLVDFAMACPVRLKLRRGSEHPPVDENEIGDKAGNYFRRTRDGKVILRETMARYLPKGVAEARKQGFSAPDASWFRGESIDFVRLRLMQGDSPLYDYLDASVARRIVEEHLSGRKNHRLFVWSLLSLDEGLRSP